MPKILVVDDEYRIRQIIRKYAEFEGYEVEEAVAARDAEAWIAKLAECNLI